MKFKGTWGQEPANEVTPSPPPIFLKLIAQEEMRDVIDYAGRLKLLAPLPNKHYEDEDEVGEEDVMRTWLLQLRKERDVDGFSELFAKDSDCVALLLKALGADARPSVQAQKDPGGCIVAVLRELFATCSATSRNQALSEGVIDRLLLRLGELQAEDPRHPQRAKKYHLGAQEETVHDEGRSTPDSVKPTSSNAVNPSTPLLSSTASSMIEAMTNSTTVAKPSTKSFGTNLLLSKLPPSSMSTVNSNAVTTLNATSSVDKSFKVLWKPGYGTGEASAQSSRIEAEREAQRAEKSRRTTALLECLRVYIDVLDESTTPWSELLDCFEASCLLRVFMSSFYGVTSKAVMENASMYTAMLRLVASIAKRPQFSSLIGDVPGVYKSLRDLMRQMKELATEDLQDEEDELSKKLQSVITETYHLTESCATSVKAPVVETAEENAKEDVSADDEARAHKAYEDAMRPELFRDLDMRDPSSQKYSSHHFQVAIEEDAKDATGSKNRQRRLHRELKALRSTLPIHFGSTIVLRVDRSRQYVGQFIIFAPENTPYDSGAFLFDFFCSSEYPNEPPKVNLQTTGQGRVRFNPNLYQNGKVCLSLLGTWRGGASGSENWNSEHSSLYQVLVSIQSAILGSEFPYFNEPTVEALWGTEEGELQKRIHANGGYERLRVATVQHAMVAQIKSPPIGFEQSIKIHFLHKRRHILQVVTKWLQEAEASNTLGHARELKEAVDELKQALDTLGPLEEQVITKAKDPEVVVPARKEEEVQKKMEEALEVVKVIFPNHSEHVLRNALETTAARNEQQEIIAFNLEAAVSLLES